MARTISFIIAVFNGETWVDRCLSSLKKQTYPHFEAIVVNDGSTDASGENCLEFSKLDPRFSVYTIPHCGLSDARNFGLSRARGDYIGFLDIDDWIEPDFTEKILNAILLYRVDMASCLSVSTSGLTKQETVSAISDPFICRYTPADYLALEYRNPEVNVRVGNRLYAKKLFEGLCFPSGKIYEDVVTNYMLCRKCEAMVHVDLPLHHYYVGNESITRSPLSEQDLDLPHQWERVCHMAKEDYPQLVGLTEAMRIMALRALTDKYIHFGGDAHIARTLVGAFRRSAFRVIVSKDMPVKKKVRSLAAAVNLSLYGRVTKFINKDS